MCVGKVVDPLLHRIPCRLQSDRNKADWLNISSNSHPEGYFLVVGRTINMVHASLTSRIPPLHLQYQH